MLQKTFGTKKSGSSSDYSRAFAWQDKGLIPRNDNYTRFGLLRVRWPYCTVP